MSFFEVWAVQPQPAAASCHSTAPQHEARGKDGLVPQRSLAWEPPSQCCLPLPLGRLALGDGLSAALFGTSCPSVGAVPWTAVWQKVLGPHLH